ncbi:MAG: hypothetical protein JRI97_05500 [Deltaproteobacteria bacterium]|nr:hypothetical protein [Deltaproteobacteria bacterium]
MHTRMTAVSGEEHLKVDVVLENQGQEEAGSLETELEAGRLRLYRRLAGGLPPGEVLEMEFSTRVKNALPGRYPLGLRVLFTDEAGYPLSAVNGSTYSPVKDLSPNLEAEAGDMDLPGTGTFFLRVKNLEDAPVQARVWIFLPREITCSRPEKTVILKPGWKKTIRFPLENASAFLGARYPVYAFVEYEKDESHHTVVARGTVSIKPRAGWFARTRPVWVMITLISGLAFLLALYASWKDNHAGDHQRR